MMLFTREAMQSIAPGQLSDFATVLLQRNNTAPANAAAEEQRLDGTWSNQKFRVLAAEPDAKSLQRYQQSLTKHGFRVATAATGVECALKLRQDKPDLLVLNPALNWGGGDGILALMQDEGSLPSSPVLLLYDDADYEAYGKLDAFDFVARLPKPVSGWFLTNCVEQVLKDMKA
jgi:DNA-binding NtrC family response regulator